MVIRRKPAKVEIVGIQWLRSLEKILDNICLFFFIMVLVRNRLYDYFLVL